MYTHISINVANMFVFFPTVPSDNNAIGHISILMMIRKQPRPK